MVDDCSVCKELHKLISKNLSKTSTKKENIDIGHRIDGKTGHYQGKKIPYARSEMRFLDVTENVCEASKNKKKVILAYFSVRNSLKSEKKK